ncbi:MAG: lamin tail domain-containing protein [Prevotellaceae bacterium]|jgi:Na+-transporting methylmalonyl-CoA/oxaloacetate decarboxylase gamma subunit|nr:lamin tail domain-containing protein [Prevotellaceae bacterium]
MNKKTKKGFLLLTLTLLSFASYAQTTFDLRINELLSHNTENIVDDYGEHSTWIEIYNPTYGTVDIGGCYVTDDINNPKKYRIPQGDVITKIPSHQYLLIWADSIDYHGPLYTNFKLSADGGYLAIYSNDGKTLIDQVRYSALEANVSYGRKDDGEWGKFEKVTPRLQNEPYALESASEKLGKRDPHGAVISVTAMTVVFSVLILLFLCFKQLAKFHIKTSKKKAAEAQGVDIDKVQYAGEETGDIYAAIALALKLYQDDIHDIEDMVITIEREDKIYSPWNSKVQTLRQTPVIRKNK